MHSPMLDRDAMLGQTPGTMQRQHHDPSGMSPLSRFAAPFTPGKGAAGGLPPHQSLGSAQGGSTPAHAAAAFHHAQMTAMQGHHGQMPTPAMVAASLPPTPAAQAAVAAAAAAAARMQGGASGTPQTIPRMAPMTPMGKQGFHAHGLTAPQQTPHALFPTPAHNAEAAFVDQAQLAAYAETMSSARKPALSVAATPGLAAGPSATTRGFVGSAGTPPVTERQARAAALQAAGRRPEHSFRQMTVPQRIADDLNNASREELQQLLMDLCFYSEEVQNFIECKAQVFGLRGRSPTDDVPEDELLSAAVSAAKDSEEMTAVEMSTTTPLKTTAALTDSPAPTAATPSRKPRLTAENNDDEEDAVAETDAKTPGVKKSALKTDPGSVVKAEAASNVHADPDTRVFSTEMHPCLWVYGACRNSNSCLFAQSPQNMCLSWFRGTCPNGGSCSLVHRLPVNPSPKLLHLFEVHHLRHETPNVAVFPSPAHLQVPPRDVVMATGGQKTFTVPIQVGVGGAGSVVSPARRGSTSKRAAVPQPANASPGRFSVTSCDHADGESSVQKSLKKEMLMAAEEDPVMARRLMDEEGSRTPVMQSLSAAMTPVKGHGL